MYLRIANPGLADYKACILMGASTARNKEECIGTYGTGLSYSATGLLRHGINPILYIGLTRMEYKTKPVYLKDGSKQEQVIIELSGKNENDKPLKRTEKLSYTDEMGCNDWTEIHMFLREFVSNALDECARQGKSPLDVEIEMVDEPRAKRGTTQVFVQATPEVIAFKNEIMVRFLHFHYNKGLLKSKILPKLRQDNQFRVYKKGVLVYQEERESLFDYNLGDEIELDESRNAKRDSVRTACSKAFCNADISQLKTFIEGVNKGSKELFENCLESYYISGSYLYNKDEEDNLKARWRQAFHGIYGENAVAVQDSIFADYVIKKGLIPIACTSHLYKILKKADVKTQVDVLSYMESKGRVTSEATPEQVKTLDDWWAILVKHGFHANLQKPTIEAFTENMSSGVVVLGEYKEGKIYVSRDLSGAILRSTVLEELIHHVTNGALDGSRDLQQAAFNLCTALAFPKG